MKLKENLDKIMKGIRYAGAVTLLIVALKKPEED